jgi:hypothetical protein
MKKTSKGLTVALLLFSLCIASILSVRSVLAQTVSEPVIPQFTLTFQDNTRVVEPTTFYTTDPYTGKQTATGSTIGASVTNQSITVRITNQPFTAYTDANNNYVQVYYDVRWKGQFSDSWEGSLSRFRYIVQDPSKDYTNIRLGFSSNFWSVEDDAQISWHALSNPVDIQVRACIGYVTQTDPSSTQVFTGVTGDWSETQTIIASQIVNSPSPTTQPATSTPSATSEPTQPTESTTPSNGLTLDTSSLFVVIIAGLLAVIATLAIALSRKTRSLRAMSNPKV